MLNIMWSQDSDIMIKEEKELCSDQDSPRIFEHMQSAYQDLNYGVTVTMTPSDGFDYLEPGDSPQLQTLQTLPSFQSLPSSPSRKALDFPPVAIGEFISCGGAGAHSPDSSGQPAPALNQTQLQTFGGGRRRKRNVSASSCSSGTSSTSKASKRRRPQITQEELMVQRNQGRDLSQGWVSESLVHRP